VGRTVKVDLLLEVAKYLTGAKAAEKSTKGVADALDEAARSGDHTASAVDAAGHAMRETARDAAKLDHEIEQTSASMRELAREIARTSDEAKRADLMSKLAGKSGQLRDLTNVRKLLGDGKDGDNDAVKTGMRWGTKIAEGMASGLGSVGTLFGRVGTGLPPEAQAAIGASIVAAVAAAAPLVGAALAGAVVGAAGVGGVVGGLMIAAQHADVKAAGKLTGEEFMNAAQRGFAPFVPAAVSALSDVRVEIRGMGSDFDRLGKASSSFVKPLTSGALGALREFMPGFLSAVERAGPVIDAIGNGMVRLGRAGGDLFATMSQHASEGGHALGVLFLIIEYGIRSASAAISVFSTLYKVLGSATALTTGNLAMFAQLNAPLQNANKSGTDFSGTLTELMNGFNGTGTAAVASQVKIESWAEATKRITEQNLTARSSQRDLESAIDAASEALTKNGRTLDINTPKGRANSAALDAIASSANTAYEATLTQTGSQETANGVLERGKAQFIAMAVKMGMSAEAAKVLAGTLFAIPSVKPKVTVEQAKAQAAIAAIQADINGIHGKNITIGVYWQTNGDLKLPGGTSLKNRWGGVYTHAAEGALREAKVYSPMGPARYAFAEPATGGEAFIPKHGDRARSLSILETAAGWYGKTLANQGRYMTLPTSGRGAAPTTAAAAPQFDVRVYVGDRELTDIVDVRVSESNRGLKRRTMAGSGAAR
jgi:hypothetical protein